MIWIWYIVIVLVVGAAWGLGLTLEWPMWIAWVVSGVGLLATGLVVFLHVRRVRARRRKQGGKKKREPAKTSAGTVVAAEFHGNVAALRTGFEKTITALEASKLGKSGRRAAEALPWYVMLGSPGAGKTAALGASGVRFPYRSAGDTKSDRVDSSKTRSCEFWMSNDAVVLDTSGRYIADDASQPEWSALLKLLIKHRPRRPLNGIVVAVSIDELRTIDDEALFAQARQIRARIDEAIEQLHMMLPVYVVVTKCDLLTGFVELFGDLDDTEVGQAWGFTNSRRQTGSGAATFAPYFEELMDLARRRSLVRLEHERDPAVAARAYAFPEQLEHMRTRLSAFVGEVFSENIYRDMPLFRGLYLTSAQQDGMPFDAVLEPCAQSLGIAPVPDPGRHGLRPRGYFLRDVFERVVFRDRFLAHDTAGHAKRRLRWRYAGAAVGLLAAAGLAYASIRSYGENEALLAELGAAIDAAEPHVKTGDAAVVPMSVVAQLHTAERRLAAYERDGVPWRMGWGMYRGDQLLPSLRGVYGKVLRQTLLADLVARDERLLREFTTRFAGRENSPNDEDYGHHHVILRRYLLVTTPVAAGEPGIDAVQRPWLHAQLLSHWQGASSEPLPENAGEMVDAYLDMIAADASLAFPRNVELVGDVRGILRRSDRTTTILVQLIEDIERQEPSLSLRDMCNSRAVTNGDRKVRAAFTRRGWEKHVKPMLDEPLDELVREEWVVGGAGGVGRVSRAEDDMAKLRSRYFKRYIDEWDQFLDPLQVASPNESLEALTVIQDLVRGSTPPLASLMQHVAYNTRLTQVGKAKGGVEGVLDQAKAKAGEAAEKAKKKAGLPSPPVRDGMTSERDVEARFEPFVSFGAAPPVEPPADGAPPPPPQSVQLDVYTEQLVALRDALQQQLDNPQDRDALPTRLKQAHMTVKGLIADREVGWHQRFSAILEPPILGLQQLSRRSKVGDLAQAWCNDVVTPFDRTLAGKYPFKRSSRYDASLADFVDFYRPNDGKLWGFYQAALTSIVVSEGDRFRMLEQGSSNKTKYNSGVLSFLQRSQDIGRAMFPSGATAPLVVWEVDIQPTPGVSVTEFTVDGVTIDYRNGPPRPQMMSWPGEGDKRGASIRARGRGINGHVEQDGDWGFLRLLEQGEVIGSGRQQVFTVRWDLSDQNAGVITVKFRPKRGPTPFFGVHERPMGFLGVFRHKAVAAPRQLVLERAPCRGGGTDG
ncbi:MAG: type VI secretion system membrane subunit TssM [Myxococcales bacterium FL481]|nr:MAG: type VI secretion system membrane subunit TssM [Myxococcales bacterium FL481]